MFFALICRLRQAAAFLIAFSPLWPIAISAGNEPVPEGSLLDPAIRFQFAIYLPSESKGAPMESLDALLKGAFAGWSKVEKIPDEPVGRLLRARLETDVREKYAVPSVKALGYLGRGLTKEQVLGVQECRNALVIDFSYSSVDRFAGMKSALQLMVGLAAETGGWIWDDETRELFTPEFWREARISSWQDEIPDVTKQVAIHAYRKENYASAITLGMSKFGLPDLVVQEFVWSNNSSVGNLINSAAQLLVEGSTTGQNGSFLLNLRSIRHHGVRELRTTALKSNATGVVTLRFVPAEPEDGDPKNRLLQIGFDGPVAEKEFVRQERSLGEVFGWSDHVVFAKHNRGILEASRIAREKFKSYLPEIRKGLRPGEHFNVKAPFAVPGGGREWMWVEVTSWSEKRVFGVLVNTPLQVPNLRSGAEVEVNLEEIFDYIRYLPDGTSEGNSTGVMIKKAASQEVPVPGSAE